MVVSVPRAKTKRGGLRQVEGWLRAEFTTPYPVQVIVRNLNPRTAGYKTTHNSGQCDRVGSKLIIAINSEITEWEQRDALLHEWAHAMVWRHPHMEAERDASPHDEEWALAYGKVYREWADFGGWESAREYDAGRWG